MSFLLIAIAQLQNIIKKFINNNCMYQKVMIKISLIY